MVSQTYSIAMEGIEPRLVEVQCSVVAGLPSFSIVGLPNKSVSESRDRIRAALAALSIALPSKRVTINLSPADLPKEGSHFDLPIALAILAAIGAFPADVAAQYVCIGELALDGRLVPVTGALPAAMKAATEEKPLLCPEGSGAEAAWVQDAEVFAPRTLGQAVAHLSGKSPVEPARCGTLSQRAHFPDFSDVKGQERAKRALEIAAAGRHNILMTGPPGAGKSMLAARIPGILPALSPAEALETSMIYSVAGLMEGGQIHADRPFRDPHHSATTPAIVGGGRNAGPGEISLAHNGVLFLDELPEFQRAVLDTLRQPLETGEIMISRANARIKYPCKFLLVAAANPCRCGFLNSPARACSKAPSCSEDYLGRVSGPLLDRFDLRIDLNPVPVHELSTCASGESSNTIASRVLAARDRQTARYAALPSASVNADIEGDALEKFANPEPAGKAFLNDVVEKFGLSARGYHRVLRVARTIADLEGAPHPDRRHVAEAASYRLPDLALATA